MYGPVVLSVAVKLGGLEIFVLNNVRADGRLENIGKRVGVLARVAIGAVNGHGRSARHFGDWLDVLIVVVDCQTT